jgi:[ribosomal protein S18]-alanine N-acetyltransferase
MNAPRLRPATPADVALTLAWSPQDDALRRWAGPDVRCPATPASLWEDIAKPAAAAFAFEAPGDGVVGYGQVRLREGRFGHLARIIVSPRHRGRGVGRALCRALMEEARRRFSLEGYSLYVFPDNANAVGLYRSLGFVDAGLDTKFNCMLMLAPLAALDAASPPA